MPVRRKTAEAKAKEMLANPEVRGGAPMAAAREAALKAPTPPTPPKKKQSMQDVMEEARGGLGRGKVAY